MPRPGTAAADPSEVRPFYVPQMPYSKEAQIRRLPPVIAVKTNLKRSAVALAELARGDRRQCAISAIPFWWRDAPPASGSQGSPPATADVVVIGSGFTGLSAALVLARAGRDVVVVDANVPGYGASTRNGGQVGSGNQSFGSKR